MIQAGIIGATGYVGVELARLLLQHPDVEKVHISSVSFEGQNFADVYPNLYGRFNAKLGTADEVVAASDVVFTALPHGVAEQYADQCLRLGKKLIDLSADFRFDRDEATFKKWYKADWKFPAVHEKSVYGLPEMNRALIKAASIIGNPGCYVTSVTLALLPAVKNGLVDLHMLIADSKSGVTGAGRNPTMTNQFCECGESFGPYAVGAHRHQPEIEHNLTASCGKPCEIVFTPHLVPMNRGIISTCYAPFASGAVKNGDAAQTAQSVHSLYADFYKNEPFVRVLPLGKAPTTKNVRYSNYCDISVHVVQGGKMLQVISALDNMLKGAASQAVQNMNIMYEFDETAGISMIPPAF